MEKIKLNKEGKKNLKVIIIIMIIVFAGSLLYFGYEKISKYNYRKGVQEGQASMVFQIRTTGQVPILDERIPNVFQWKWFPMQEICARIQ